MTKLALIYEANGWKGYYYTSFQLRLPEKDNRLILYSVEVRGNKYALLEKILEKQTWKYKDGRFIAEIDDKTETILLLLKQLIGTGSFPKKYIDIEDEDLLIQKLSALAIAKGLES